MDRPLARDEGQYSRIMVIISTLLNVNYIFEYLFVEMDGAPVDETPCTAGDARARPEELDRGLIRPKRTGLYKPLRKRGLS